MLAASLLSLVATPALAASPAPQRNAPAASLEADPFAPVFIVASEASYKGGINSFARSASRRLDSTGKPLMLVEIRAHQLPDVSRQIHEKENRCGGFFAFASQADAERFLRTDRSAQAIQGAALVAYTLENQATVNPWLPLVAEENIYNTINTLQAYTNRYYTSTYG
jgi:leucyl aminopeptidase